MSVTEIAALRCRQGAGDEFERGLAAAIKVIAEAEGCRAVTAYRCVEDAERFVLAVEWDAVAAHEAFRQSPDFPRYRGHIADLFGATPEFAHYQIVART